MPKRAKRTPPMQKNAFACRTAGLRVDNFCPSVDGIGVSGTPTSGYQEQTIGVSGTGLSGYQEQKTLNRPSRSVTCKPVTRARGSLTLIKKSFSNGLGLWATLRAALAARSPPPLRGATPPCRLDPTQRLYRAVKPPLRASDPAHPPLDAKASRKAPAGRCSRGRYAPLRRLRRLPLDGCGARPRPPSGAAPPRRYATAPPAGLARRKGDGYSECRQ
jgi:hypothetical protein